MEPGNRHKRELLTRVRRIRGQIEALERAIEAEKGTFELLQVSAACRGALTGLISRLMEGHIKHHLLGGLSRPMDRAEAAEELVRTVRAFLR